MEDKINLLFTISYKGTNYHGWQVQPNKITVQGELEKTLSKIFNEKIEVVGSGRTDAGVHALKASANALVPLNFIKKHFFSKKIDFFKLKNAINGFLKEDIKILSIKKVPLNFNARFNAKQKTYVYKIQNSGVLSPFEAETTVYVKPKLDINKMISASKILIGTHNFQAFCSAKTQNTDFVRTIYDIKIYKRDNKILFEITGNGFLYNMVRIIVGTLIEIGAGNLSEEDLIKIKESKSRSLSGKTMPALGLFLKCVKY